MYSILLHFEITKDRGTQEKFFGKKYPSGPVTVYFISFSLNSHSLGI